MLDPGPRTTVEDLGRRGVARWGIPCGGAFDPLALTVANRLVGNRDDDAGLEITLGGPTLVNAGDEPLAVALNGADCDARLVHGAASAPVRPGRAVTLAPGDVLRVGYARAGARAWLAVAGGIAVPRIAGSRATALGAGFGGLDGIDYDCWDFSSQAAAQGYFERDGGSARNNADGLDRNHNGLACEPGEFD